VRAKKAERVVLGEEPKHKNLGKRDWLKGASLQKKKDVLFREEGGKKRSMWERVKDGTKKGGG